MYKIIATRIWETSERYLGGIWWHQEASERHLGGIWETSGGIWEASGRHLGGIWRPLGGIWRHLQASGGI